MNDSAVILAALGIMATIVGALVWLLKKLFTQNDTTVKEGNKVNLKLAASIDKLAEASNEQIKQSRDQASKQRKFEELVIKKLDELGAKADRNHDAIVNKQTVREQHVEHQTVVTQEGQ
ncbi:hypothetical protein [Arthrobacter sp. KNU40]|uniref:hypothetical protein n=1 Tax=Arthrobacter sp. KNU40 TaxID=3447965 RepID=UPI003F602F97